MHIDTFRMNNVLVALARTSVALVVGVEYDFIFALVGNTYSVFLPFDIRKVADNDYLLALFVYSSESDNRVVAVVR